MWGGGKGEREVREWGNRSNIGKGTGTTGKKMGIDKDIASMTISR